MEFLNDWGISIAVFAPTIAAVIMMILPKKNAERHKWFALGASLVSVGFGVAMLANFHTRHDSSEPLQYLVVDCLDGCADVVANRAAARLIAKDIACCRIRGLGHA